MAICNDDDGDDGGWDHSVGRPSGHSGSKPDHRFSKKPKRITKQKTNQRPSSASASDRAECCLSWSKEHQSVSWSIQCYEVLCPPLPDFGT